MQEKIKTQKKSQKQKKIKPKVLVGRLLIFLGQKKRLGKCAKIHALKPP
jgi:hypothetical protein